MAVITLPPTMDVLIKLCPAPPQCLHTVIPLLQCVLSLMIWASCQDVVKNNWCSNLVMKCIIKDYWLFPNSHLQTGGFMAFKMPFSVHTFKIRWKWMKKKSVLCQLIDAKRIHNWHTVRISTCEHPDDLPNMCQVSQSAAKIGTFSILKMWYQITPKPYIAMNSWHIKNTFLQIRMCTSWMCTK